MGMVSGRLMIPGMPVPPRSSLKLYCAVTCTMHGSLPLGTFAEQSIPGGCSRVYPIVGLVQVLFGLVDLLVGERAYGGAGALLHLAPRPCLIGGDPV